MHLAQSQPRSVGSSTSGENRECFQASKMTSLQRFRARCPIWLIARCRCVHSERSDCLQVFAHDRLPSFCSLLLSLLVSFSDRSRDTMLFRALAATAALAAFVNASPVLQKRQGGGTDLPTYREVPNGNGGYKPCDDSTSGSSYLDPIVESVPEGVDPKTWKGYTTENEPYANAALIIGTRALIRSSVVSLYADVACTRRQPDDEWDEHDDGVEGAAGGRPSRERPELCAQVQL